MHATLQVTLTPRQRKLMECLADGYTLTVASRRLGITLKTAQNHLAQARERLFGAERNEFALAVAYAVRALSNPMPLSAASLCISMRQRVLVPLVAMGMPVRDMADELGRPLEDVREDVVALMVAVGARTRCQFVQRAWQHGLLTRRMVLTWVP